VQLGLSRVEVVNGVWQKCIGEEYHKAAVKVEEFLVSIFGMDLCSKDIHGGHRKSVLRRLQQACFLP